MLFRRLGGKINSHKDTKVLKDFITTVTAKALIYQVLKTKPFVAWYDKKRISSGFFCD